MVDTEQLCDVISPDEWSEAEPRSEANAFFIQRCLSDVSDSVHIQCIQREVCLPSYCFW